VRDHLDGWRVYHLHDTGPTSPMKKTADIDDNRVLRPDGANLAAFLYLLQEKHPGSYDLIRRTVQLVTPFFDDFRLAPQRLNPDKIRLEWKHKHSALMKPSGWTGVLGLVGRGATEDSRKEEDPWWTFPLPIDFSGTCIPSPQGEGSLVTRVSRRERDSPLVFPESLQSP
jgi:hypothetical protein